MELPTESQLLPHEASQMVDFDGARPSCFGRIYDLPFDSLLALARIPVTQRSPFRNTSGEWLKGYNNWAIPMEVEDHAYANPMATCERILAGERFRNNSRVEHPDIQLAKMFAKPFQRQLEQYSATSNVFKEHGDKLFIVKVELSPYNSSAKRDYQSRGDDPVQVWRLLAVFGDTKLDSFHDQILAPAMGWRRHYHAYQFVVPTNGAIFGPRGSDSIDMMHVNGVYMLNAEEYDVRHVLRKRGDRLGYEYDLGDDWKHIITVLDIVDKGSVLTSESSIADDSQILKVFDPTNVKVDRPQLFAGEINCPPEDSSGCDGMGEYGSILKRGPNFRPPELGLNWQENRIRGAFDFNLADHQARFNQALAQRKNPTDGNLIFSHPVGNNHDDDSDNLQAFTGFRGGFLNRGRKVKTGHTGHGPGAVEVVGKTKPRGQCSFCGKQAGSNSNVKILFCSRCKLVDYCGVDCQRLDWKKHKNDCKPAEMK